MQRALTKNLTTKMDKLDTSKNSKRLPNEEKQIEIIDLGSKSPTKLIRDKHEAELGDIELNFNSNPQLPYKKIAKQKKFIYQPFIWNFDTSRAQKLESSLFKIAKSEESNRDNVYQLQPNTEKIKSIRQQITICFEFLYNLCFYNQTEVDYSSEMIKLYRLLKTINSQLDVEKGFDYEDHGEQILLNNVVSFEMYEQNSATIDEILKKMLVPALQNVKTKYFTEESLEMKRDNVAKRIEQLGNSLNTATIQMARLQDRGQCASSIFHITQNDLDRAKNVKPPRAFFEEFIDIYSELRLLYMECKVLSELRTRFKRYLKINLFLKELEAQLKFMDNLINNLKEIITKLNNRLIGLKIQPKDIKKAYSKIELNIDETKLDLDKIIENKTIEKIIITGIRDVFNHFEKECKNLSQDTLEKENSGKVLITMHKTCQTYLDLCLGFNKNLEKLRNEIQQTDVLLKSNKYFSLTKESLKEELLGEYREMHDVIMRTDRMRDKFFWSPVHLLPALSSSVHEFSLMNKSKVHMSKAIAFKIKYIQTKLAKIIRGRIGAKNKLFFSNTKRIKQNLGMNDVIELMRSKRVWQSMPGPKSEILNLQGKSFKNKTMNRYIYCNEDLDKDLLKFIGMFIYGIN